jgi:hypothetical protein
VLAIFFAGFFFFGQCDQAAKPCIFVRKKNMYPQGKQKFVVPVPFFLQYSFFVTIVQHTVLLSF